MAESLRTTRQDGLAISNLWTLLYISSGGRLVLLGELAQHREDLTGDVALEATQDFLLGLALGSAPGDVVAGRLVPTKPHDHDPVQGGVGVSVPAPVQAVPAGLARRGLYRGGAAQRRERGLRTQPGRVVPGAHQQLGGDFGADPEQG